MNIIIDWQKPILLSKNKLEKYTATDLESIEERAGVYYFARRFGESSTPFYIGETLNLRNRLKNHLDSARISDVLRGIENPKHARIAQGARYFHYGYLVSNAKAKKKRLRIVQKHLIDEAISKELTLLNKHGTVVLTDTIEFQGSSEGRGIYAKSAIVEKQRPTTPAKGRKTRIKR
ncbi:hypothetical protein D7X55_02395 [Corallococcus sp. AB049A]|uniref:hypothetical protein n=1 Tax=Corallococcus sp. AB049A TaxID=2316721 RepID=UPI000EEC0549|nr:hypothetical protein [Corallococcus sp. AB049A]RKI74428.1 hypothetical protein D7X55_02395 [Corallococcus sp. AB049A]